MNLAQFWDGRAKDLKEQAGGPIANPGEKALTHELAVDVLESIPHYQTLFQQSFGEGGINIDRVTEAIAAFEETLVSTDSWFDRWLRRNDSAMTAYELKG